MPRLVDVLDKAVDDYVGLGQKLRGVTAQNRHAAKPRGDVEHGLLIRFDTRLHDVQELDVGTVGLGDDVHVAGMAANAAAAETDLADEDVDQQPWDGKQEDDGQPGQADRRLLLALHDDGQHDEPDKPFAAKEDCGPR